jgi:hypothetical protein
MSEIPHFLSKDNGMCSVLLPELLWDTNGTKYTETFYKAQIQ